MYFRQIQPQVVWFEEQVVNNFCAHKQRSSAISWFSLHEPICYICPLFVVIQWWDARDLLDVSEVSEVEVALTTRKSYYAWKH